MKEFIRKKRIMGFNALIHFSTKAIWIFAPHSFLLSSLLKMNLCASLGTSFGFDSLAQVHAHTMHSTSPGRTARNLQELEGQAPYY